MPLLAQFFAAPAWLLLIPLVPLFVWWLARRPEPTLTFSDVRLFDGLPLGRAGQAFWGRHVLRGLTLGLVLLALAGPRWPDGRTRLPAEGIALMLVVDVSGSMATADFRWPGETEKSRLDATKRLFRLLVAGGTAPDGTAFAGRARDQIGLVVFATWPDQRAPLTLSHSVLLDLLDAEEPRKVPEHGLTNIGDAIDEGLRRLESVGPRRRKVMILLSDGEHNVAGDPADPAHRPRQAARLAAPLEVTIHTIDAGGGTPEGEPGSSAEQREAGRRNLQAVAAMTGGQYFEATDTDALARTLQEIDRLERRPVDSDQYRRYHEFGPWLGMAALVALVLLLVLEATRWRVLP